MKNKAKLKEICFDGLFFIIGSFIYAAAVNMFTAPNHIAPGGFTGASTLINYLTGLPIGLGMFLLNVPLFIISYKMFGKDFIIKTLVATLLLSVVIDITANFYPIYTGDKLLAALFGGVCSGGGIALILFRGATSGGTDILAKLLRIKWPHISMGTVIMIFDLMIVLVSGLVYGTLESVLYAFATTFTASRTIDYVLYGRGYGKVLTIFTDNPNDVSSAITSEMGRGVTILDAKGAYTGEKKSMLICAVRTNEIAKITKIIKQHDSEPFIIVSEASEVFGQGFKPLRKKDN
ncbi:MAG: YitT family protein [Oscillospiraceae bacterium]|nr:YitT family protein [Oscillospiraceae bacterium]